MTPNNNKGFTLIELMVAMMVLLFVSLALMQTALISIDSNVRNILRDESVRVAEARMDEVRNTAFANLPQGSSSVITNRSVRNLDVQYQGNSGYFVNTTVADLDVLTKRIDVAVSWTWKGEDYNTTLSSIKRTQ